MRFPFLPWMPLQPLLDQSPLRLCSMEHLQFFHPQELVALMPSPALEASKVMYLLFRVGAW